MVPATRRARRTGSESFGTQVPAHGIQRECARWLPDSKRRLWNAPAAPGFRGAVGPRNRCSEIAVGDGRIHQGAQLAPQRIGARRQHLGHENGDQLFRRDRSRTRSRPRRPRNTRRRLPGIRVCAGSMVTEKPRPKPMPLVGRLARTASATGPAGPCRPAGDWTSSAPASSGRDQPTPSELAAVQQHAAEGE